MRFLGTAAYVAWRVAGVAAGIALLAWACSVSFVRHASEIPTPEPAKLSYGDTGALEPSPPSPSRGSSPESSPSPDPDLGSFEVLFQDQAGNHPAGIPVSISGPLDLAGVSDTSGLFRFSGPAGDYLLTVPLECSGAVRILQERSARFGIAAGESARVTLGVRWEHRFAPSVPVFSNLGPDWPLHQDVELRFQVADRCRHERASAPGAAFPSWRVRTTDNVRVVAGPRLRAAGDGSDSVTVACTAEGYPSIWMFDSLNPADEIELVELDLAFGFMPACRNL